MFRPILSALVVLAGFVASSAPSQAFDGFSGYPGYPGLYGIYHPYGIRYRNTVPNPPYFAVNPPVYYGARHARPYGVSPFAALPVVHVPDTYRARQSDAFVTPPLTPQCNPFCAPEEEEVPAPIEVIDEPVALMGPEQTNPFVLAQLAVNGRTTNK